MVIKKIEKLRDKLLPGPSSNLKPLQKIFYFFIKFLSAIYSFVVVIRRQLYNKHIFKAKTVEAPVISLGNILLGGTGKTPLAICLAKNFQKKGYRPALISRGYGRVNEGREVVLVSKGEGPLVDYTISGDEPWLMAVETEGLPVLVSTDRVKAAKVAIKEYGANLIILDDAFQHLKIKRDCDILLFSKSRENYCNFLTLGFLREPLSAHKYAHILLSTGTKTVTPLVKTLAENRRAFAAFYQPVCFYEIASNKKLNLNFLDNKNVFAYCGLGNAQSFKNTLSAFNFNLLGFEDSFKDHESYSPEKFNYLNEKRKLLKADYVLTTTKDIIKLPKTHPLHQHTLALQVEFEINNKELFIEEILKFINLGEA